jgi:hypothetical protein
MDIAMMKAKILDKTSIELCHTVKDLNVAQFFWTIAIISLGI